MKISSAILSFVPLFLVACSSNDPVPSQELSATINGNEFRAISFLGERDDLYVSILGSNSSGEMISIEISPSVSTGTHDMPDHASIIYYDEDGNSFAVDEGEINITVFTETRFEATFNFEGFAVVGGQQNLTVEDGIVRVDLEE